VDVDEQLLQPEVLVAAALAAARIDLEQPLLLGLHVVHVVGRGEVELELGRLERGVAADVDEREQQVLAADDLLALAEDVDGSAAAGALRADRRRQAARLVDRVGHEQQRDEAILAVHRLVALERVLVVRVVPALRQQVQRLEQAPAVRHRDGAAGVLPRLGRRHRLESAAAVGVGERRLFRCLRFPRAPLLLLRRLPGRLAGTLADVGHLRDSTPGRQQRGQEKECFTQRHKGHEENILLSFVCFVSSCETSFCHLPSQTFWALDA
jgi:hypothetical protein